MCPWSGEAAPVVVRLVGVTQVVGLALGRGDGLVAVALELLREGAVGEERAREREPRLGARHAGHDARTAERLAVGDAQAL